ncbi:transformer-2 protein homolog alpha-like [Uranotaenia lowii]|uniref:transformer-2 protein homolog alpha-like n=1 Tax=Uranotaenia lowii TaxID=190385 RepID=UPI00247AA14F|nr:transformer-2 protein homolog alpha-like [Uranotaenia lowii]
MTRSKSVSTDRFGRSNNIENRGRRSPIRAPTPGARRRGGNFVPRDRTGNYRSRYSPSEKRATRRYRLSDFYCLGVFGMSGITVETDLRKMFERYGPIERIIVIYDQRTGESRNFGFVYFRDRRDAWRARDNCNGALLHGRRIRVDDSLTKAPHPSTPGEYKGTDRLRRGEARFRDRRNDRRARSRSTSNMNSRYRRARS